MKIKFIILVISCLSIGGCTLHVCGNSEIAHQVGNGTIGEQQLNDDKASADIKADLPIK